MSKGICSFPNCGEPHSSKGLCKRHYDQKRHGRQLRPLQPIIRFDSLREKIEHYLDKPDGEDGCWIWSRSKCQGYGHIGWGNKVLRVHRAYVKELGWDVPDDLVLDHLCRNRACSNPDHLEVVTPLENFRRAPSGGLWKRPDVCKQGHPFDEANTYINPSGSRACRACHAVWSRQWRERKEA